VNGISFCRGGFQHRYDLHEDRVCKTAFAVILCDQFLGIVLEFIEGSFQIGLNENSHLVRKPFTYRIRVCTFSANVSQIQMGGPQLENEGVMILYTIKSTSAASSETYEIGLSSGLYPKDIICGWGIYINLQVGNITNPTVVTSCHYVPPPENNPGLVYSEIFGLTNSTT